MLALSPALAQEAATTREREALPPRAANRSVQRDLLSVLEPIKRIDSGMFRQLRGVGLTTKPFGTEFDGLCRRDAVTLWYAATETTAKPEDAPLRPYSVEAQAWFHIVRLPRQALQDARTGEGVWQAECASVGNSEETDWFAAKDAQTAVQGALMLKEAVEAVRSGKLKAEPCLNIIDAKKSTCEAAILADADISKIDSVEACSADAKMLCYVVDLGSSTKLTIKGRASEGSLVPSAITSIAIEQYIIVT
ncbi:hypothetical protein ACFSCW_08175 [Sphingomonas tabacisoli]|uniref:Uncharacterized protein n=1 Tax=Sphingomonas tabacisoli TaxID=2249466 RepID=A0ABW4I1G2_9SPHN